MVAWGETRRLSWSAGGKGAENSPPKSPLSATLSEARRLIRLKRPGAQFELVGNQEKLMKTTPKRRHFLPPIS